MLQRLFNQPEYIFLFTALILGTVYSIFTPPFQVPDEINHFYRAYQVSEGEYSPMRTEDRLGGMLPAALRTYTSAWEPVIGKPEQKVQFEEGMTATLDVAGSNYQWYDFPNTAIYSFFNYIPQAAGITITRFFSSSIHDIYRGSRWISFIFWIVCIFQSIRMIPGMKWLISALALLPMSLYVNSSVSADLVINGMSFLFVSWIFRIRSKREFMAPLLLTLLLVISFLIPQLKLVYMPVLLLVLLIPKACFRNCRMYWLFLTGIAIVAGISSYSAVSNTDDLYIPYAEYSEEAGWVHLAEGSDKDLQMDHLKENPGHFGKVIFKSLTASPSMYLNGYIGTFGWLEFGLPVAAVVIAYVFLLLISVSDDHLHLKFKERLVMLLVFLGMISLLILSQHLIWGIVGGDKVMNLQGRYFIPVFLIIFLMPTVKIKLNQLLPLLTILFAIGINICSLALIFNRFY